MTVRTVERRGVRRQVIDISYQNAEGTSLRYRRDAEVQTLAGARAEERRRLALIELTGSPLDAEPTERGSVRTGQLGDSGAAAAEPSVRQAGRGHVQAGVSFRDFVEEWYLPLYATTRLKPSTRRGYEALLRPFLFPRIGSLDIAAVTAVVVRRIDTELVQRQRRPATRRQVQCVIRSVLRHAKEVGVLAAVPELPKLPKVGATITRAPTSEEVGAILAAARDVHRLAFELAVYAGLRASEVRGLKWPDVDLERGLLVVRRGRTRGVEAPPKSGHERIVPLHPRLLEVLPQARARARSEYVSGRDDRPWTEDELRHGFRSALRRAGVSGVRLHDLRHYFVTMLFATGASAPVVQRLAGHEHLTTTQRYAHARLDDLTHAVARLPC